MAVATDPKTGTMPEVEGRSKVSPPADDRTPTKGEVSPEDEPRIYTQKQADALIHAAKSEWGRKEKEFETEKGKLSSNLIASEAKLEDIQAHRDSLQQQIEDLTSDDPKKFDLIKRDRELRKQETGIKGTISKLEEREKTLAEREKKVSTFEVEVLIETIAGEYEDGDAVKLKKAVSSIDNPKEEAIRTIADILWQKKAEEGEKTKAPKPYSGKTSGGGAGRMPTLDEFRAVSPTEAKKKVDSGEWVLPHGIRL